MFMQEQAAIAAAEYITLDIETGYAPDADIRDQIEAWQPPSNIKDGDKIEERRQKFIENVKSKSSLTDAAPIVSICFKSNAGLKVIMSSMGANRATQKPAGWQVMEFDTEIAMLSALSMIFNNIADENTRLVGHNIIGFDLPKLRNRMLRGRVKLPACLVPKNGEGEKNQPVYDTMRGAKYFSQEFSNSLYVSFDALAKALGLKIHKHLMSGDQVPLFAAQGRVDEIILYNALDVEREEEAFLLMTGA